MSGIIKGIGKVFKKVGKFVLKVAPYALAAAAVVFTGGAALGLGFAAGGFSAAVGGVVTSLHIGGAVGGALTGAITGAGMGAAVGGILGGKKGLKKGFITGGLTGGLLGAVSPATVGIVKDPASGLWTTKQGIINAANTAAKAGTAATSGTSPLNVIGDAKLPDPVGSVMPSSQLAPTTPVPGGTAAPTVATKGLNAGGALSGGTAAPVPSVANLPPVTPVTGAPMAASSIAPAAPIAANPGTLIASGLTQAPQAGSGIGGFLNANPALAGNLLTSVGSMLGGGEDSAIDVVAAQQQAREDQGEFAYGGAYSGNPKPFGDVNYGTPSLMMRGRWFFNPQTNKVEERPV